MKTVDIVSKIYSDFAKTYRGATPFVNSGELWDFCIETISNPITMNNIIFANKLGIAPVKSLLTIYELKKKPAETFEFTSAEAQYMGSLMGFVFRFVLGYQKKKERYTVKKYGVTTAALFLDGEIFDVE